MKIKRISKASIVEWLKRNITLAVILSAIAVFFAYNNYKDKKPAQISREYYVFEGSKINMDKINVDKKNNFINLMVKNYSKILCFNSYNGMPNIVNASSKSIKDFRLEIDVVFFGLPLDLDDIYINPDFEVVDSDTLGFKLRYKYDVFHPKSTVPVPFQRLYLNDSCSADYCFLRMYYSITYEGISEPKDFRLYYKVCYTYDDFQNQQKQLDDFLTLCYKEGYFTEYRDNTIVTIVGDRGGTKVVNPPKRLNDAKFEKFKKNFIEDSTK